MKRKKTAAKDRLFSGVYSTGISYADRTRERDGDYKRLAFLSFATLTLEFQPDCPDDLRELITREAARIQARRGEHYEIDSSGHTVLLGTEDDFPDPTVPLLNAQSAILDMWCDMHGFPRASAHDLLNDRSLHLSGPQETWLTGFIDMWNNTEF